jgi:hypothetical protein
MTSFLTRPERDSIQPGVPRSESGWRRSRRNRHRAGSALIGLIGVFAVAGGMASAALQSPGPDPDEETRPSRFNLSMNGGRGLVRAVSPEVLGSGEVAAGIHALNVDRHPGDLDFFDYRLQVAFGLGKRTELFFRISPLLDVTSTYQEPTRFPVPPLDLFVDIYPTTALREEPYFLFTPEAPYKTLNIRSMFRANSRSSGDIALGFKQNLLSEIDGDVAGLGWRVFLEIPTETPRYNTPEWKKFVGVSGEWNYGAEFLFSRTWKQAEFLANVGYKHLGDPDRGLRLQFVDSSQTDPDSFLVGDPIEAGLNLSDQVRLSAGVTLPLWRFYGHRWWFLSEFNYDRFVGSHTSVERRIHPADVMLGLQTNVPWFPSVAAGGAWQLLLNGAGRGTTRTTSFTTPGGLGDINFGELVDPALFTEVGSFLSDMGATFSEGSSRVFSTNNPAFDPWRNIPTEPALVRADGNGNFLVFVSWRIGVWR